MSPADGLPLVEDGGARARVLMGTSVGRDARRRRCIRRPSMPISSSTRGGSIPIDADADERARDAGRRRGRARWRAARAVHALRARARAMPRGCRARSGGAADADGRRGLRDPRATCSGISSPRRATGSTRPRRIGRRCASRSSPATTRSSSRCPKCRRRSAIRDRIPARPAPTGVTLERRARRAIRRSRR